MENEKHMELAIFMDDGVTIEVPFSPEDETVWLTANQMALLFDKDEKTIRKHINNVFSDNELERNNNTQKMRVVGVKQPVPFYTLDVIISVGYRVKSRRGVAFRKWATSIMKKYLLKGYAVNQDRMKQLGKILRLLKRTENDLDAKQVLTVIEHYNKALSLLDDYDHQSITRPPGNESLYVISYEECKEIILSMQCNIGSKLFGNEKDESLKASIGDIYQTFDGKELYQSLEEKAAHLLYFLVKNHSFTDGNKRIAATLFLYFLDKNNALFSNGAKRIDDHTIVALTLMVALSKSDEMETMVSVIMNCME
jgi:prophage maintenance system killer protein